MSTAIEFRNVSFAVPQGRLLLDTISLKLEEGSTTAILGRSGSGKTTLLRTVNRMVEPSDGDVMVHGTNIRNVDLIALRRATGYVIQETGLFPHFTVERNVGAPHHVFRRGPIRREARDADRCPNAEHLRSRPVTRVERRGEELSVWLERRRDALERLRPR